jgi:hypothetical protein
MAKARTEPAASGQRTSKAASTYAVGIDLGTTHCVLAYHVLGEQEPPAGDAGGPKVLAIPQLVAPATVESRPLLPSFLYLGTEQDGAGTLDLPWARRRQFAVGELARKQAADVPARTVVAAKSWLCHSAVDRQQPILPWNAPEDVPRISPVAASQRYLEHLADAWNHAFPQAPLERQHVVLTVPASFDASARELTREAALAAGLPESLVLLEEPQAALYAWLADRGDRWRRDLRPGDVLLVCDVGGGTTDFTLIRVAEQQGELVLERVAVGNHLLVGGDNMDLALAHMAAELLAGGGHTLDPWQSVALWHACRAAKENLLAEGAPARQPVSVLGRGSRLIKGTLSVELERGRVEELLLEGFFPRCDLGERPARRRASGFLELGLPFEPDTAITRHLAAFLAAHAPDQGTGAALRPTHVLFSGGVFQAEPFRRRLLDVLASWFEQPPVLLPGLHDLHHAVARGAAMYALAKQGRGIRIRGGTARAYYVGIEAAAPAVPGIARPLRALCVVPFGMEEGTSLDVPSAEIGLVVGEPVQFRFFSSAVRKEDPAGKLLTHYSGDELTETAPLETTLVSTDPPGSCVPVRFHSAISELGMLELWCVRPGSNERWKLEFSVREADAAGEACRPESR